MGDAEFGRIFKANPAIRRSEWATVIICSFLLFIALGVAGFLIVDTALIIDWGRTTSWWLLVAGAPLSIALIFGYLWSRSRCRFVLALDKTHVQAGPICIMYEDVDQVSCFTGAFDERRSSPAVEITGRGKLVRVRIKPSDRAECVKLLQQRCRNAIIVSESDEESLPTAPTDAARVAGVALARFRRRTFGFTCTAILSGALVVICALYLRADSHFFSDLFSLIECIVALLASLWQAVAYFKKARQMQAALSHFEEHSSKKLEA